MKKVLFIIAFENFRDEELLHTKNELESKGIICDIASIKKGMAKGMLGAEVNVNLTLSEISPKEYSAIIIVGGMGVPTIRKSEELINLIKTFYNENKLVCAICWAPTILAKSGILKGKNSTVWVGYDPEYNLNTVDVLKKYGANYVNEDVVIDGNIITANGPSSAKKFGQIIFSSLKEV